MEDKEVMQELDETVNLNIYSKSCCQSANRKSLIPNKNCKEWRDF